jgi:hypothetical protein
MMDSHLSSQAHQATVELGHSWLGAEHLLIALFDSDIAGQALRDCGLSREAVTTHISKLPDDYHRKSPFMGSGGGSRLVTADAYGGRPRKC